EAVDKYPVAFQKGSKAIFQAWFNQLELRRLQVAVHHEHKRSIKWLERLGFKNEGTMLYYDPKGETFLRYARYNPWDS
ncbi:MAG: hypothetical protein KAR06_04695, partial [Deltaproteobacteria bacterium]|nr:hypothetical protein [Deltaproteobacteria bacterium]